MQLLRKIAFGCIATACLVACKKEDEHLPPQFNYDIPAVAVTENVAVGAYYVNTNTAYWAKKYTSTPTLGEYNPLDAAVMTQQGAWADQAALDFLVFNWNGATGDNNLLKNFITNRKAGVRMVINYNTAHLKVTNATPLTGDKLTQMITELKGLAAAHFGQDYYYQADKRPVILITPLNLAASAAASIDFATVIPAVKAALQEDGVDLYIIGEITSGWLPPQRYAPAIRAMDATTLNNWSTDVYDRYVFFPAYTDQNWQNWRDSTSLWKVDFVPCIFPGFNDKAAKPTSKLFNIDHAEKFFTDMCNVAKRNMSARRLVLINSWNDYASGTTLEPAKEYGTQYLDITKQQFKVSK